MIGKKIKESIIDRYRNIGIDLSIENYKKLTILTYELLVLDESRRVGKEGIAIIPESYLFEKEMMENLKIYSKLSGSEFYVLNVERSTWTMKIDSKVEEVGHWQDNSSKVLIYLQVNNSNCLDANDVREYLRLKFKDNLITSTAFRDLLKELF